MNKEGKLGLLACNRFDIQTLTYENYRTCYAAPHTTLQLLMGTMVEKSLQEYNDGPKENIRAAP